MTQIVVVTRDPAGDVRATYNATVRHPLRDEDTSSAPVPSISEEGQYDYPIHPPAAIAHQVSGEFMATIVGVLNTMGFERKIVVELHPSDTERWEAIFELMCFSFSPK